jgi:hypothetical protein
VRILIRYEGVYIYRVYIPLQVKDKIIYTSHVCFDKGGFIIKLDFKAINDEIIHYQAY